MVYKDKFIFVHVPKTGGIAMGHALGGKSRVISTHTPLRCVEKGDRFAFGFMRNPWARMVSLYRFMCQKPFRRTDNFDQQAIRDMGFKTWLMEDQFIMQEDDHPMGEPWVMKEYWRTDESGYLAPMQRRPQLWWLEGCDFIGKLEQVAIDWPDAQRMAGLKVKPLARENTTKGRDWRLEYDNETIDFVSHHFQPDIEYGDYSFE